METPNVLSAHKRKRARNTPPQSPLVPRIDVETRFECPTADPKRWLQELAHLERLTSNKDVLWAANATISLLKLDYDPWSRRGMCTRLSLQQMLALIDTLYASVERRGLLCVADTPTLADNFQAVLRILSRAKDSVRCCTSKTLAVI